MKKIQLDDEALDLISGGVLDELSTAKNIEAVSALLSKMEISLSTDLFTNVQGAAAGKNCTNTHIVVY